MRPQERSVGHQNTHSIPYNGASQVWRAVNTPPPPFSEAKSIKIKGIGVNR